MQTAGRQPPMVSATDSPASRLVFGFMLIFLLGVIGLVLGLALGVRGLKIEMLCWAVATSCVCAIPLLLDQARPASRRHIVFSMVSLCFGLRFALPVFTYYLPATGPVDSPDLPLSALMPRDIAIAQALIFVGLLSFYAGYALPLGRRMTRVLPPPRWDWTGQSTILAAVVLTGFGWILFIGTQFGVIPSSLGSGLIGAFADATVFGPAILAVAYLRRRSMAALVLLFLVVPITSGFNFFTGYKRLVLTPPAMVGLAWIVTRRRIATRWVVLGLAALLLLYPTAEFYRHVILANNTRTLADVARNPGPALDALGSFLSKNEFVDYLSDGLEATGSRIDGVGHAAVIIRDTPDIVPYQGGWTLGLVPLTYIPRAIWPDKPVILIGAWIIDNYRVVGHEIESSIGPTWVGELYLNFGVWGIVPGMVVMGILLRFASELLTLRTVSTLTIVLETILIYYMVLKLTGSIADVVNSPILTAIPILSIHVLIRLMGGAQPVRAAKIEPGGQTSTATSSVPLARLGGRDPLSDDHPR